jgi:glycosyltransferase involved in cell wall biosynthesis
MTVIQAWACGIPAVVCREPYSAASELVDSPDKGRVVAPDPRAVAAACRELLELDPVALGDRLTGAAREYDWKQIARQLSAEYQRLLQERIT